jgi:hypothetical protein
MNSGTWGLALVFASLLLVSLGWLIAVWRSSRRDRTRRDFRAQARSIFDEYEPEGVATDHFPGKGPPPSEYLL